MKIPRGLGQMVVNSESGYHLIRSIAEREVNKLNLLELGKVESVNIHSAELDRINYSCSIILLARTTPEGRPLKLEHVPILTQFTGEIIVPFIDDLVLISYIYGEFELPVIIGKLYTLEKPPQVYRMGDYKLTFDPKRFQYKTQNPVNRRIIEFLGLNEKNEYRIEFRNGPVIRYTKSQIELAAGDSVIKINYDGRIEVKTKYDIKINTDAEAVIKCKTCKIKSESDVKIKCENCKVEASGTIELGGNGAGIVTEQSHKCYFTGAPPLGSRTVKAKG
jgi:hypothetical protein